MSRISFHNVVQAGGEAVRVNNINLLFAFLLSTHADRQGVDISVWIYRLLFVCFLFVFTVTEFSAEDKASGVKICTALHRRPRQGSSNSLYV